MLEDAIAILGDRQACLGREMTKVHEEIACAKLSALAARFAEGPVRGEITLAIASASGTAEHSSRNRTASAPEPLATAVTRLVDAGWDRKEAMRHVARQRGMSRRAVYQAVLRARGTTTRGPGQEE
jgi:16S rRNA (cytidine1402-2'-O)-methyltransferase